MDPAHRLASVLYAYEKYGPGKLSDGDERRYWEECAVAAELQTCDPGKVPRTREGVLEYFEQVRPRLAASEATQAMMDHLLSAEVAFPPLPTILKPGAWVIANLLRAATVATIPRWQRQLGGLRQPRLVDALIVPVMKPAFWIGARSRRLQLTLLAIISPGTVPVAGPMLRGLKPEREETLTPSEAFDRHHAPTPAELYAQVHNGTRPSGEPAPSLA